MGYARSFAELKTKAINWWPQTLLEKVAAASSIPLLVSTQEKFISILTLSGDAPDQIFDILEASKMPPNLFLKHLVVMVDYGGEPLKRLGGEFNQVFPKNIKGKRLMKFVFREKSVAYEFQQLPVKSLSNILLGLDGKALAQSRQMSPLFRDVIMLLLHGATSESSELAGLAKCDIGSLLGQPDLIEKYVKERYIHVSRITSGASTNSLGQIAQTYVCELLEKFLPHDFSVKSNGSIKLKKYGKTSGVPFDVVISRNNQYVGVEISFQVTTNSTIERKAALASERQAAMHQCGSYIAYVLDGAGNFERSSALTTLCTYSDCTVAYSESEIEHLAGFIREKLS
jgi:hypothetical protein